MTSSGARRWLVGIRHTGTRAARVVRHPVWTTGTVVRGLLAGRAPATARRAVNHLRQRSLPLRLSSPFRRWFEHGEESLAIRWIGPINLRHRSFEALLCHAPAGVEYRMTVPDGSRFLCACAISPQVWQEHPPRVEFTIGVEVPAAPGSPWRREVTVSIDPGKKWTDRRWHPVSIDLPANNGTPLEVVVTLSTRVASGPGVDNAWAIFGEPRFEWPRSTGRSATLDRHLCQPSPDQRASLLASTAQRRWNHDPGRRGLSALGGEAHAHRRGAGRPRAGARGAFLPTGHQRDRSRLQHRPAVAARLHRIGPTPGVPELGAVPVRRCVDDACNRAGLARVRIRQTDSDSLLVGQWRDLDRVEPRPRNRARGVRGPARSRRRARARRPGRDRPAPQHASGSRRHLLGRRQARSERREVRRVLQARLVAGALPHVHVHVPHDGGPAAAHERGGGLPNRLRRRSGLRPPAASDGTDRANSSHPAGALPLAQAA